MKKQNVNVTLTLTAKQASALCGLLAYAMDETYFEQSAEELFKLVMDARVKAGTVELKKG